MPLVFESFIRLERALRRTAGGGGRRPGGAGRPRRASERRGKRSVERVV
jgi:hypothetical protein